jgi:hypothetical protein
MNSDFMHVSDSGKEQFEKAVKAMLGQRTTTENNPESSPSTKMPWYKEEDLWKVAFENKEGRVYQGKGPEGAVSLLIEGVHYWTKFEQVQALQDFLSSRVLENKKASETTFKKQFTPTSQKKRSSMTHLTPKKKKRK